MATPRQTAQPSASQLDILPSYIEQAVVSLYSMTISVPGSIDRLDAALIELLAAEPRVGALEASRRLGVARGTVQARLDRLQDRGVITGYGPEVDPAALGYEVTAFITLEIRQVGGHDPVAERLAAIPEVLEARVDQLVLEFARKGLEDLRLIKEYAWPSALGLGVIAIRWQALLVSGALTGLAGAFLTLAYANTFVENISAGRGFVALSVVIVGRWNSWGLAAASLLFGAAMALQFGLQALGTVVPYQLFLALPYALTLVVLAGFGGQAAAPSALGEPYRRQ